MTSIFEGRHIDLRKSTPIIDLRKSKIEGGNITPKIRRRILSTTALLYNFKKVYFDQDKECAEVLYEFLSVGRFDVTGGQSDIEEMLRTIATA